MPLPPTRNIYGFDPKSIPGMQLWFDAADASSIQYTINSGPPSIVATGGTITDTVVEGVLYRTHTFTSTGTFTLSTSCPSLKSLVVGGGGGGGFTNCAGGGGAGGAVLTTSSVSAGSYTVTVGNGGLGGSSSPSWAPATNGQNSIFNGVTGTGGGYGGTIASPINGASGGCGGGGSYNGGLGAAGTQGGSGANGSGFGTPPNSGAGGGGMGGNGGAPNLVGGNSGGAGGLGATYTLGGISYLVAGGGAGGSDGNQGLGGSGIGGNGGTPGTPSGAAGNGVANTGSGGGGGGGGFANTRGGNGGSGIVIITYPCGLPSVVATGGTITDTVLGGLIYRNHLFNSIGNTSFTLSSSSVQANVLVVAGGGGGGGNYTGGGGGAGGAVVNSSTFNAGTYTVTVGAGGNGWSGTEVPSGTGSKGGNSSINSIVAYGGGGGGDSYNNTYNSYMNGGCGGGGGGNNVYSYTGTGSQGGSGGAGYGGTGCGGGGGMGGSGIAGSSGQSGAGGPGVTYTIGGQSYLVCGGGGGGGYMFGGFQPGAGGSGGGGAGGRVYSDGNNYVGFDATYYGSGGGGSPGNSIPGGAGYKGLVIISYVIGTVTTGSNVSVWQDKSGNGYDLTSVGSNYPTYSSTAFNGYPCLVFTSDQSQDMATIPLLMTTFIPPSAGYSYFAVFNQTGGTCSGLWFQQTGVGSGSRGCEANGSNIQYDVNGTAYIIGPQNTNLLLSIVCTTGNQSSTADNGSIYLNGTSIQSAKTFGTASFNYTDKVVLFAKDANHNYRAFGYAAEFMQFNRALTSLEQQQIEGYLAWKWGFNSAIKPPTIPNCILWLDAGDSATITGTTTMSAWKDKSGKNNNALFSGSVAYSSSTVSTSSSAYFYAPINIRRQVLPSMTLVIVYNYANNTGLNSGLFGDDVGGGWNRVQLLYWNGAPGSSFIISDGNGSPYYVTALNTSNTVVYIIVINSYVVNVYVNGVSAVTQFTENSTSATSDTNIYFGTINGGGYWNNAINYNEILMYSTALTTTQIQSLNTYLTKKWNVTGTNVSATASTLPSNHLFYPLQPFVRQFNPVDIPGCVLWLDGADGSFMTFSGSNITQWNDKSGNGNNATATGTPTYNTTGLNSLPAVAFNGSCYFQGNVSITGQTLTCFAVGSFVNSNGSDQRFISLAATGQYDWNSPSRTTGINNQGGTPNISIYRNTPPSFPQYSNPYGTPFIACSVYDSANGYIYVNGTPGNIQASYASTGTFAISKYCIGEQVAVTGEIIRNGGFISEILIFTTALTTQQRQQVEGYLAAKWNISLSSQVPLAFSNCVLWLDAADSTTITKSGTTLTAWANKGTAGGSTTTQAGTTSTGTTTQNGLNVIVFPPNTTQSIAFALGANAHTWFWVAKCTTTLTGGTPYWAVVNQNGGNAQATVFGPGLSTGSGNTYTIGDGPSGILLTIGTSVSPPPYSMAIYAMQESAASTALNAITVNGTSLALSTNLVAQAFDTTSRTYSIGGTGSYNTGANLCELILYSGEITFLQRMQIESYLSKKWGIPVSSSATTPHPFTLLPPSSTVPFIPTNIAGCILWLDATDPTSAVTSGTTVTQWNDKSTQGNNSTFVNGSPQLTTLNGVQAIAFNGTTPTTFLGNFANGPYTYYEMYVVANFVYYSAGGYPRLVHVGRTPDSDFKGGLCCASPSPLGIIFYFSGNAGTPVGTNVMTYTPITNNTPFLFSCQNSISGANLSFNTYLNGQTSQYSAYNTSATGYSSDFNAWAIGGYLSTSNFNTGGDAWNGAIGEVLMFSSTLTTSQKQQVEGYLAKKWNLSKSLASSHAYYNFEPSIVPPVAVSSGDLYAFSTFTFTNCTATGTSGPTPSQCTTAYSAYSWTSNTAFFNMTRQGFQLWTVPADAPYVFTVAGAGFNGDGGLGAVLTTILILTKGDILQIAVGQSGTYGGGGNCGSNPRGGAGGTFVVTNAGTPLVIAGGGGGYGNSRTTIANANASVTTSGNKDTDNNGTGGSAGYGGTGNGANLPYGATSCCCQGGGGAGFLGNGGNGYYGATGGGSFANGLYGGNADTPDSVYSYGGFGGGGGASYAGGGGGGYSGGAGGNLNTCSCGDCQDGGGGGSYSSQTFTSAVTNTGMGYVTITKQVFGPPSTVTLSSVDTFLKNAVVSWATSYQAVTYTVKLYQNVSNSTTGGTLLGTATTANTTYTFTGLNFGNYSNFLTTTFYANTGSIPDASGPTDAGGNGNNWGAIIQSAQALNPIYFGNNLGVYINGYTNYSALTRGYVYSASAGTIQFRSNTDDGLIVNFNGTNVIYQYQQQGTSQYYSGTLTLPVGFTPIRITWYDTGGGGDYRIYFSINGGAYINDGTGVFYNKVSVGGNYAYATVFATDSTPTDSAATASTTSLIVDLAPSVPVNATNLSAQTVTTTWTFADHAFVTNYTVKLYTNTTQSTSGATLVSTITTVNLTYTFSGLSLVEGQYLFTTIFATGSVSTTPTISSVISLISSDLYPFTSITLTPCGFTGRSGPTLSACRSAYSGTNSWVTNTSYFNVITDGYQLWTVPSSKSYTFVVAGARGGDGYLYGRGGVASVNISLTQGDIIRIVVGQMGITNSSGCGSSHGGGGGGTYVYNNTTSTLLIAIGGGGGGGTDNIQNSLDANVSSTSGNSGQSTGGAGGSAGNGGSSGSNGCTGDFGGGGGGYSSNGGTYGGNGGAAFVNGSLGGAAGGYGAEGGFGGGGGGSTYNGNGGGGYSGGGGGALSQCSCATLGGGGGGGSYFIVAPTSSGATNTGNGYVTIS